MVKLTSSVQTQVCPASQVNPSSLLLIPDGHSSHFTLDLIQSVAEHQWLSFALILIQRQTVSHLIPAALVLSRPTGLRLVVTTCLLTLVESL